MIVLSEVHRAFRSGPSTVHAVDGVDLVVATGELIVVTGRSGAGKTTLLNLVGGLDRPDAGTVTLGGTPLHALRDPELARLRRDRIGFVFQTFGLLPVLTAAENVEVVLRMTGQPAARRRARVGELLEQVGLADRANHRPHELSGGEQQRVAVARALANRPAVLVADEPTGQLDSATGRVVLRLIQSVAREAGATTVIATHDPGLVDIADRVVELRDGRIVADSSRAGTPHQPG